MNDDERLREGFAKLRADDARRAPPFDAMWSARRRRSPWVVLVPVTSVAAAAAVLLVWCTFAPSAPKSEPVAVAPAPLPVVADDPAPLDFLLDLPMGASLAKVPDFDKTLLQAKSR